MRRLETFCQYYVLTVLGINLASAQAVPSAYADLYRDLDSQLTAFDSRITREWNGSTYPTDAGAELSTANGNRGMQVLAPNTRLGVVAELNALKSLGLRSVVVAIQYPLLNRPYLDSISRTADYDGYLNFYKFVADEVRSRGMRLVVESGPVFPGVYSLGSGLDVARHYAAVTDQQYIQARAAMAGLIAREIQPDYLQIGAEPDTEAQITGRSTLRSASVYAGFVGAALAEVRAANVPHVQFGAGIGTWLPNGRDFIDAYVRAGVDFIDLHVYPVNRNFLENTIAYADAAIAQGRKVIIAEAWLLKMRDSELGVASPAADAAIFARDAWSFWAPLDQKFLAVFTKFGHWKQLQVFSAFWTRYLFAYVDYETSKDKSSDQLILDSSTAAAAAIVGNRPSSTGQAFSRELSAGTFALSNASYRPNPVAPESILSIFGSGLSGATATNASIPLPLTLSGTTATVIDRNGRESAAGFYLVSPSQINAVLPAGIPNGPAQLRIRGAGGVTVAASLSIAPVAPALYSASADGRGTPAAILGRLGPGGNATFEPTFECSGGVCSAKALDISPSDEFYLGLFGTGIRGRSALNRVTITIGGLNLVPIFAGPQPEYPGLDQMNVLLPKALVGRGRVPVTVSVDGSASNVLTLQFR